MYESDDGNQQWRESEPFYNKRRVETTNFINDKSEEREEGGRGGTSKMSKIVDGTRGEMQNGGVAVISKCASEGW